MTKLRWAVLRTQECYYYRPTEKSAEWWSDHGAKDVTITDEIPPALVEAILINGTVYVKDSWMSLEEKFSWKKVML